MKKGIVKRLLALVLAGVMLAGSTTAYAETLKDVFNAKYYSESYEDLAAAFGTNKTALYNHFKTYGLAEGRQMSEIIDVVAYREANPDLEAAFGDNWDAYVNHYFKYGAKEGRPSYGDFDAYEYANRYEDVKAAFGYNVKALYKHYTTFGKSEGRNGAAPVSNGLSGYELGLYHNSLETPISGGSTGGTVTEVTTMGQLRDPETGAPIANATIRFTTSSFNPLSETSSEVVYGDGYVEVTTDENGYYEIPDLEPGVYSVEATAPGYMTLTLNSYTIGNTSESVTMPTFQMLSTDITGSNSVSGTAIDATTGAPIANVTLNVRADWNNTSGAILRTITTDSTGFYEVELARGYYTIEFVIDGYVSTFVNVASSNAVGATHCTLSPATTTDEVASTEFRIVLTWGERPYDLDSHLVGPSSVDESGFFHVYFGNKVFRVDGQVLASLDVDDTSSFGPETVTIVNAQPGEVYYYSIHDWTNQSRPDSTQMSESGANIKVYQGSVLVAEYNVPVNQAGYIWNVFKIDNGTIYGINQINTVYNTMYGHYMN